MNIARYVESFCAKLCMRSEPRCLSLDLTLKSRQPKPKEFQKSNKHI